MKSLAAFLMMLFLATLACSLPGEATTPVPVGTPTPVGDTLRMTVPFATSLQPGEFVPGTGLQYVDREGDTYVVMIDGQRAVKRLGDSFLWNGVVAPGVYATYNLRLTTAVLGALPVAGTVNLAVLYPEPTALDSLPDLSRALSYENAVINYTVPVGYNVPGTTLVYEGVTNRGEGEQAIRVAQLSGLDGYPYLAAGDSLVWTGTLRDNVSVRYNLRLVSMNEENAVLVGTGQMWAIP